MQAGSLLNQVQNARVLRAYDLIGCVFHAVHWGVIASALVSVFSSIANASPEVTRSNTARTCQLLLEKNHKPQDIELAHTGENKQLHQSLGYPQLQGTELDSEQLKHLFQHRHRTAYRDQDSYVLDREYFAKLNTIISAISFGRYQLFFAHLNDHPDDRFLVLVDSYNDFVGTLKGGRKKHTSLELREVLTSLRELRLLNDNFFSFISNLQNPETSYFGTAYVLMRLDQSKENAFIDEFGSYFNPPLKKIKVSSTITPTRQPTKETRAESPVIEKAAVKVPTLAVSAETPVLNAPQTPPKSLVEKPSAIDSSLSRQTEVTRNVPSKNIAPIQVTSSPKTDSVIDRAVSQSQALAELSRMEGMESVVKQLSGVFADLEIARLRSKQGSNSSRPNLHVRFEGNPGTGKTTVARAYAQALREIGFFAAQGIQIQNQARDSNSNFASNLRNKNLTPGDQFNLIYQYITGNPNIFPIPRWIDEETIRRVFDSIFRRISKFDNFFHFASVKLQMDDSTFIWEALRSMKNPSSQERLEELFEIGEALINAARFLNREDSSLVATYDKTTSTSTRGRESQVDSQTVRQNAPDNSQPLVEVSGTDFVGPEAVKKMNESIQKAMGGVLLIDEIYTCEPKTNHFAKDALGVLLKEMEDKRDQFVVIVTGYSLEMENFLSVNPGFKSRFSGRILFEDYDDITLEKILRKSLTQLNYSADDHLIAAAVTKIARERGRGFGNARAVRNLVESVQRNHARRASLILSSGRNLTNEELNVLTSEDFGLTSGINETKLKVALSRLEGMPGLGRIKNEVKKITSLVKLEEEKVRNGLSADRPLLNALFVGNPGTGKTTVGKIYGETLSALGYLTDGEVIVIRAGDLVGSVVGESEKLTREAMARAKGKVLFIDEAYTLYQSTGNGGGGSNIFGKAVLDTLVGEINTDSNSDSVVILAGYAAQIDEMLTANPGLARRFPRRFVFENYTDEQLMQILERKLAARKLTANKGATEIAKKRLLALSKRPDFGNAGEVENLVGTASLNQAARLGLLGRPATLEELTTLIESDFNGDNSERENTAFIQLSKSPDLTQAYAAISDIESKISIAEEMSIDPRESIEFNYKFKGRASSKDQMLVAQALAKLYSIHHILASDEIVRITASDLIGQYVGQTTAKVKQILNRASGKTLMVTDFGSAANAWSQYHREAFELLLHEIRSGENGLLFILSGTEDEFTSLNGVAHELTNAFQVEIDFDHHALLSLTDAKAVFSSELSKFGLTLSSAAEQALHTLLVDILSEPRVGVSEKVANLARKAIVAQKMRSRKNGMPDSKLIEPVDLISINEPRRSPVEVRVPQQGENTAEGGAHATAFHFDQGVVTPTRTPFRLKPPTKIHEAERVKESAELNLSPNAKRILNTLEKLRASGKISDDELKDAIRSEAQSDALLAKIGKDLGFDVTENTIQNSDEIKNAIRQNLKDATSEIKDLIKRSKTDEKLRKLIQMRVCVACGLEDCDYLPITWFEEAI